MAVAVAVSVAVAVAVAVEVVVVEVVGLAVVVVEVEVVGDGLGLGFRAAAALDAPPIVVTAAATLARPAMPTNADRRESRHTAGLACCEPFTSEFCRGPSSLGV